MQVEKPGDKILFGRTSRSRLTYSQAVKLVKQEMEQEKEDLEHLAKDISSARSTSKFRRKLKPEKSDEAQNGGLKMGVKHVIEKQNGRWEEEEESLAESIEEYREDFETDSEIKTEI